MSVVKINVIEVPEGRGEVLEERFAARAGEVEHVDGFESFELLRPTEGTDRYLVVTRWRDDAAFQAWLSSDAFRKGHAQSGSSDGAEQGSSDTTAHGSGDHGSAGHGAAERGSGDHGSAAHGSAAHGSGAAGPGTHGSGAQGGPAATGSELWGFEVVTSATGRHA